ncbi:hypothetical protein HPB47_025849 [Ixodes persulcatus]|uniref:Uncharacterized protein n=1 Tax=Ixodes persulcatus TaxID=34615 RepID=A0AC60Q2S6_IXOPE|nr:hypothetical protein HPB47_025849 [Ixodes persulcatus]
MAASGCQPLEFSMAAAMSLVFRRGFLIRNVVSLHPQDQGTERTGRIFAGLAAVGDIHARNAQPNRCKFKSILENLSLDVVLETNGTASKAPALLECARKGYKSELLALGHIPAAQALVT